MAERKHNRFNVIWAEAKRRCYNPNDAAYPRYGGKGLTLSDDWLSYKNFKRDMLATYEAHLTLDRIDNAKGYSKQNCRWATMREQQNNRTNNNNIEYDGKTMTLPMWADEIGIKSSTLRQRYYVYKWNIEKCMTTPLRTIRERG